MQYFGGQTRCINYERCATAQQQSHYSWYPQLILVLWLLVEILQNFLTVGICLFRAFSKGRTIRKIIRGGGAGEVPKKYSRKGKLN